MTHGTERHNGSPLGDESGFAMIAAMLVMVLITGLASAAMLLSNMDMTVAGNYRAQRTGEVVADGGLDLVKAMIFGQDMLLNLPMSIPSDGTAATWSQTVNYNDNDMKMTMTIKYKQEDNVNFNTAETYPDEVVRYGKDYNFAQALKLNGKQPIYSVTVSETNTGTKAEADLISSIGFRTPGALFVQGALKMYKYYYVTDESIEITSAPGTPAVASASAVANITIEKVKEAQTITATQLLGNTVAGAGTINVASTSDFAASGRLTIGGAVVTYTGKVDNSGSGPNQFTGCTGTPAAISGTMVLPAATTALTANAALNSASITVTNNSTTAFPTPGTITVNGVAVAYTGKTASTFTGLGAHAAWGSGTQVVGPYFNAATDFNGSYNNSGSDGVGDDTGQVCLDPYCSNSPCLHNMIYSPSQVKRARDNGYYNEAREMNHILIGVGDNRFADLNAAYTAAGGGSAGASAANALFKFYVPAASDSAGTVAGGGFAASAFDVPTAFTPSTHTAGVLPTCTGLVCNSYPMPPAAGGFSPLERMMGVAFADMKSLADTTISCTASETYMYPVSGSKTNAKSCNMTTLTGGGLNLGTPDDPQVIFINSPGASPAAVGITTTGGTQVSGYGVLVIDGDADIAGSFNWTGLMLVKGKLSFVPYANGTVSSCTSGGRSGVSLATRWNGFLMVGGDMYLWTYTGGSIILGYDAAELQTINTLISNAVPHKILSWRRSYN